MVVTGSLVKREGYNAPTPLSVIGDVQIESAANANLGDFVYTMPAFANSQDARTQTVTGNSATAGINSLNLRNLGANRTLTLMDGHRIVPAHQADQVDASLIPQQLVQRVDVVTGGASAVYGSDAIAGVVNFILNKNYTGLKGEISGGETTYGDGRNAKFSLTAGTGLFNDRAHLLLSGEFVRDEGIRNGDDPVQKRHFVELGGLNTLNPAYVAANCPGTNCQPQRLIQGGIGYSSAAPGGVVISGPLKGLAFGDGGLPYQQIYPATQVINGIYYGVLDPYMAGGDWQLNDPKHFNDIAPEETRYNVFARGSYNLTNDIQVYAQFSSVRSFTEADAVHPILPSTTGATIKVDNAFLPAAIVTRMQATGTTQMVLGTLNRDLGPLYLSTHRVSTIYTIGATGELNAFDTPWTWDVYAQKGNSTAHVTMGDNISKANFYLASDAVRNPTTGSIVCRINLTDPNNPCKPLDVLGYNITKSSDLGQLYVHANSEQQTFISQNAFGGTITGNPISDWAGPVSLAFSMEYREDSTHITVDPRSLALDHVFGNFNPLDGDTNVTEGSVETVVPITTADFALGKLDINAAGRYTSYNLFGDVETWKVGLTYDPIDQVTIRLTRSTDIRAPSHLEAFTPASTAFGPIVDPFTNTSPQGVTITKGNPNLVPEVANTVGAGFVLRPDFLPGFTMSVDYWDINLHGAIDIVGAGNTLTLCYNGTRPDLCANIGRNAAGILTSVTSTYTNLASREVTGVDYEASYSTDIGFIPGTINLHANATNYMRDYSASPVVQAVDRAGEIAGVQRLKYTGTISYNWDPYATSLTIRGHSGGKINATYIECAAPNCPASTALHPTANLNHMPAIFYLDWSGSVNLAMFGLDTTLFANIRNLENKPHPLNFGGNFNNGLIQQAYDADGRIYRIGWRFKM